MPSENGLHATTRGSGPRLVLVHGFTQSSASWNRVAAELEDEKAWEVVAEAIQTMMRRHALERPYERLKELTRGRAVNRETIEEFVAGLPLDDRAKAALLALEPKHYVGLASELVERFTPRRK